MTTQHYIPKHAHKKAIAHFMRQHECNTFPLVERDEKKSPLMWFSSKRKNNYLLTIPTRQTKSLFTMKPTLRDTLSLLCEITIEVLMLASALLPVAIAIGVILSLA